MWNSPRASARSINTHAAPMARRGLTRCKSQELRAAEIRVGCKRVARLMKAASLRGASRRPWVLTTVRDHGTRPAPDLFHPNFVGSHPTPWGLPISLTFRPGRAFSTWRWCSTLSAGASPAGPWPLISAPNWSSQRSTWPLASAVPPPGQVQRNTSAFKHLPLAGRCNRRGQLEVVPSSTNL